MDGLCPDTYFDAAPFYTLWGFVMHTHLGRANGQSGKTKKKQASNTFVLLSANK
jgi:hypothetical protein